MTRLQLIAVSAVTCLCASLVFSCFSGGDDDDSGDGTGADDDDAADDTGDDDISGDDTDDDTGGGDDASDDETDDDTSGSTYDDCVSFYDSCGLDGEAYCTAFEDWTSGDECYDTAVSNLFNCYEAAGCDDADALNDCIVQYSDEVSDCAD